MKLKIYNTLTRKKEEFIPLNNREAKIYSCGPTVYSYQHIGNLRTYIFSDILKRILIYNHYKIKHVMNVTDVGHLTSDEDSGEDKMERGAKDALYLKCPYCKREFFSGIIILHKNFENIKLSDNKHQCPECKKLVAPKDKQDYYYKDKEKKKAKDIADYYLKIFKDDFKKLNITEPDIWTKATDYIKEQIKLIETLEKKGYTYKTSDGIYFDTSKLKDYGKLAKLDIKGLQEGRRVSSLGKKNKTDFALWKFSPKPGIRQQEWNSPWGVGFPGWHIECSAMSMKELGKTFDIHTGGIDHIPVHHTNEIAQSESSTGKKFVNYWLHGNFLTFKGEKVSKSKGGLYRISELEEKGFSALSYRYLCLATHYRKPLNFSVENLKSSQNSYYRLKNIINEIKDDGKINKEYLKEFEKTINDDLNIPEALQVLWKLVRDEKADGKYQIIKEMDKVFGFNLFLQEKIKVPKEVKKLLAQREVARKNKEYGKSDDLRKQIKDLGFEVDDTPDGAAITGKTKTA